MSAYYDLRDLGHLLAEHLPIEPPGGKCLCGYDARVGLLFPAHVADVVWRAGWRPVGVSDEEVEAACKVMHSAYEAAAAVNGWETQERSRKDWDEVPEANKATMRVAVRAVLESLPQYRRG